MTADTDNIKDVYLTSFGNEPAETESGFISIAACIDTYVNEITDLKRVMSDDIYNQVNEQGALLYGNLAIMRYLRRCCINRLILKNP